MTGGALGPPMVVKDVAGRHRYIAFRLEGNPRAPSRGEVVGALRGMATTRAGRGAVEEMRLWLTLFDGTQGILKVAHTSRDAAVEILRAIRWVGDKDNPTRVVPLGTSGTLRQARARYLVQGSSDGP